MATSLFGASVPRRHDGRLLRGEARYLDDIRRPGLLHVVIVRSPHAHAVVRTVVAERARRMPGVVAVVTARDLGAAAHRSRCCCRTAGSPPPPGARWPASAFGSRANRCPDH